MPKSIEISNFEKKVRPMLPRGRKTDKESELQKLVLQEQISPRKLAFDVDGVFADTFRIFVETARNQYDVKVEYEDITEYDFRKVVDIDDATSMLIIQRILDDPVQMGIKPIKGAIEVITRLSLLGPVLFVTARPGRTAILEWLLKQLKDVDRKLIRLEATGTHQEKIPVLLDHGVRYFVEDRLDTCYLLASTSVKPIVFEQPWNRKPHPFPSVRTWKELSDMIEWADLEKQGSPNPPSTLRLM